MARAGAIVIAMGLAFALGGCGSSGSSSLFSTSPLDMFRSSPKATVVSDNASPASIIDTEYDCPEVKVRAGAATLMVGSKPGEGEPNALDVRYQGSILRTARECHLNGNTMTMKVGIEGRLISGPAGAPGNADVPLRIAVVQDGPSPKVIMSKFGRETVPLTGTMDRANFTHIEDDISFPLPAPITQISTYVVYVGFDPQSAQPQPKKPPPRKPKQRPGAKPQSS
ncbi:MAG TPA: hypothetical protein VFB31_13400 [Pseudolabrys sp.]|nr:hypothetical protein [Pseudolabrys sp.]